VIAAGPALLAGRRRLSYLRMMLKPAAQGCIAETTMAARRPVSGVATAIIVGSAVFAAAALLAAAGLWFHYGTAVFFEMIATGLAACF
jgi:hypothetical protein